MNDVRWRSGQTDCLSCSRICVILDAGDQRRRCQRQKRTLGVERKTSRESKGVGKDSRSALCEVAVVRGIGIIACMGQKHVGVLGSRSSFLVRRPGCGVFLEFPFGMELVFRFSYNCTSNRLQSKMPNATPTETNASEFSQITDALHYNCLLFTLNVSHHSKLSGRLETC